MTSLQCLLLSVKNISLNFSVKTVSVENHLDKMLVIGTENVSWDEIKCEEDALEDGQKDQFANDSFANPEADIEPRFG